MRKPAFADGARPIRIRAALEGDLPAVTDLLRAAQLPTDGLEEQFGAAYAVAEAGDAVIGAAGIEEYAHAGLLRSAVVAHGRRGLGVGEDLTRDRLQWAAARGLTEVWLLTTTAAAYFPRFGFQTADRASAPAELQQSREFRDACPASAVAMRLDLTRESQ